MAAPPGRRATVGGPSAQAQKAPRSAPRASLAVSSRSSALPTFTTPLPPSTSTRRGPATPATTSAAIRQAQLINTPATTRARRSAVAATTGRRAGWRMSLQGQDAQAEEKLLQRQEIVERVARDALEGLLSVGYDEETGEPTGRWVVDEKTEGLYATFEKVKATYLSKDQFLDASALSSIPPRALSSPSSPLNQLIRLCNTVTFLYLLFSSARDPTTGTASRMAAQQLRNAAGALLRHVKPEGEPVDDALLRLLIDLECQAFITTASLSRSNFPPDPHPFFSPSLSSLLPPSSSRYSTDRSASIKLQSMQSAALKTVEQTGGDWRVLRTKWSWEGAVQGARDWVEREVVGRGEGGSGLRLADAEESEEVDGQEREGGSVSPEVEGDLVRGAEDDVFTAGGSLEGEVAGEEEVQQDEVREEEEAGAMTSDDEVAVHLGVTSSASRPARSTRSFSSPLEADEAEQELDELDEDGDQVEDDGTETRAAELMGLLDASDGEDLALAPEAEDAVAAEDEEEQAQGEEEEEERVQEEEEEEDLPVEAGRSSRQVEEQQPSTRLRFGPGNKLYRAGGPKQQRSLLDRQPDAVKISFDSQSQSLSNSPSAAAAETQDLAADGEGFEVNDNDAFDQDFGGGFDEDGAVSDERSQRGESVFDDLPVRAKRPSAEGDGTSSRTKAKVDKGKGRAHSREPSVAFPASSTQGMSRAQQWLLSGTAAASSSAPQASSSSSRRAPPAPAQAQSFDGFDDPDEADSDDSRRREKNVKRRKRSEGGAGYYRRTDDRDRDLDGDADRFVQPSSSSRTARAPSTQQRRQHSFLSDGSDDDPELIPPRRSATFVPSSQRRSPPARVAVAAPPPVSKRAKLDRRATGERRPWSASEERFFEECLRQHGCRWSRIRDLHGKNGKVSDTLRYRDNVGLKDKARNMKAKFIRAGLPVPPYLQEATSYPQDVEAEDPNVVVLTDEEDEEE